MNRTMRTALRWGTMFLAGLAATGCLQLDMAIQMHEDDGGATVTERLRLSRALLELDRARAAGGASIARHLQRDGAAERMKQMGKGMTLVSHAINEIQDGSRESVAVYRIPEIDDLRLPNPFVQDQSPAPAVRVRFNPIYKRHSGGDRIGDMDLSFAAAGKAEGDAQPVALPPAATPFDLQLYRDLQPVFADLMDGFMVRVTLTVPGQPQSRGRPAGDARITLLSLTHENMDRHAENFLKNEEAMLALLQFKLNDPAIIRHTNEFPRNHQVPVHRGRSPYGSTRFRIRPTRHLYAKYFAGRPKAEGGDQ